MRGYAGGMRMLLPSVVVAAAAVGLVVTLDHAGSEPYYVPWWGVGLAVAAFAGAVAGAALVWRSGDASTAAAATLAAALGAVGLLAILTIGLLLLVAAVPLVVFAARRPGSERAARGGVVAGAGLAVLGVLALQGPLVDCESGRAGEGVFLALGSDEAQSEQTASPDGSSSGSMRGEGYAFEYACSSDGRLVRFELTTS